MNIRCPKCEFTRSVDESKVPSGAELATCPKCKHRFRFRTVEKTNEILSRSESPRNASQNTEKKPVDIWEAVDSLHERWQKEGTLKNGGLEQENKPHQDEQNRQHEKSEQNNHAEELHHINESRDAASKQADTPHTPQSKTVNDLYVPYAEEQQKDEAWTEAENSALKKMEQAEENTLSNDKRPTRDLGRLDEHTPWGSGPESWKKNNNSIADDKTPDNRANGKIGYGPDGRPRVDSANGAGASGEFNETEKGYTNHYSDSYNNQEDPNRISPIPWEMPGGFGSPSAMIETIRRIILDPKGFFSAIPNFGSLAPVFIFNLLIVILANIMPMLWAKILPNPLVEQASMSAAANLPTLSLPLLILLIPVFTVISLAARGMIIYGIMRLFFPDHADFNVSLRVMGYSAAPLIFTLVPILGVYFALFGHIASMIMGIYYAHKLSWIQAASSVVLSLLLMGIPVMIILTMLYPLA